jgi:hypothetical protein
MGPDSACPCSVGMLVKWQHKYVTNLLTSWRGQKPYVMPDTGPIVLGLPIAQTESTELRCSIFQYPIHFSPIRKIEALESFENV